MASLPVLAGQELDEGLEEMWLGSAQGINAIDAATENWRNQKLPLAKIKKIMKSEDLILQELEKDRLEKKAAEEGQPVAPSNEKTTKFMISGEAPVLMSKACELMIKDLSFRAWRHTERNRRRTLQKQDLHAAVGESEVYDFLIDIVPRVTTTTPKIQHTHASHIPTSATVPGAATMMPPAIPVGMQVAGMSVGLPAAALPQQATPTGAVIDHANAGMMQLMGTAQQHQAQHQPTTQFHHDPSQQIVVGAQQQTAPHVPQHMHPQVVQQHHHQHMQQAFTTIPQLPPPSNHAPIGAPLVMPPATGAPLNSVTATTTPAPGTTEVQAGAQQWSEGVDPQAS
mmetsp:Transcript_22990/g.54279  ORF Transcript_22990/g.54279 Transcript_22990/m.54279 type:complete len:340 (+) Transcript_22990:390-1409(+)